MIDIDSERVRFEAAMKISDGEWRYQFQRYEAGYLQSITQFQWEGWLAAKRDANTNGVSYEQAAG